MQGEGVQGSVWPLEGPAPSGPRPAQRSALQMDQFNIFITESLDLPPSPFVLSRVANDDSAMTHCGASALAGRCAQVYILTKHC